MRYGIVIYLLLIVSATAQSIEPSEADKVAALKRAYQLPVAAVGEIPLADPKKKNEIDALADRVLAPPPVAKRARLAHRIDKPENNDGVCARHHMHKVTYGDKWRCRK